MTKNEIKYVIENQLNLTTDRVLDFESDIKYIVLAEGKNIFPLRNSNRLCFDSANEVLKVYHCDKTNLTAPASSWILQKDYDEIDGVIYKYLMDNDTNMPLFDFYSYDTIKIIAAK